jgi:hypothetical protein
VEELDILPEIVLGRDNLGAAETAETAETAEIAEIAETDVVRGKHSNIQTLVYRPVVAIFKSFQVILP